MAFNKAKADERKSWLLAEGLDAEGGELVPTVTAGRMGITEFVNRELVHFSRADTVRSIPSLVDGLKPGQVRHNILRKQHQECVIYQNMLQFSVLLLGGCILQSFACFLTNIFSFSNALLAQDPVRVLQAQPDPGDQGRPTGRLRR